MDVKDNSIIGNGQMANNTVKTIIFTVSTTLPIVKDFHFCINYRFSDGLRPSWPQSLCSVEFLLSGKLIEQLWKIERLFPPSFELGTFRVLGERDNHYTTETCSQDWVCLFHRTLLGTRIKLQIALHSLICKYLLFLAANKKNSSVLLESSRLSFLH